MSECKHIHGAKLIGWQKDAAKIFESLQPSEKMTILASRQKGKSFFLSQVVLYVCINRPKSVSYYVNPTNNQNRSRFRDFVNILGGNPLISKLNESTFEIRFKNGSSINFLSAESGDNLRGNTCKNGGVCILDECAFISDDVITTILTPYVTVHKANMILVSTPRFKRGYFYEAYIDAVNGVPGYKYIDVSDYDNSFFITEEQIEDYRRKYTPLKFQNEILGQFGDLGSGVFGDFESVYKTPDDIDPVYCGIDFSSTGEDLTALVFFNKKHEMCRLWYDKDIKDPVDRINKIIEIINSYPTLKHVVCETNSIGAIYISLLRKGMSRPSILEEFTTTNESKRRIIENLASCISQKTLTLLKHPLLEYQLGVMEVKPLTNNNYTYDAAHGSNGHCDLVMATAFAVNSFETNKGKYLIR